MFTLATFNVKDLFDATTERQPRLQLDAKLANLSAILARARRPTSSPLQEVGSLAIVRALGVPPPGAGAGEA